MFLYILLWSIFLILHLICISSQCISNCSTTSQGEGIDKGTVNLISCTIQEQDCHDFRSNGPANRPKLLEKGWYVYEDTVKRQIALNFSWSPNHDSSIRSLRGYRISVINTSVTGGYGTEIFFCIDTLLEFYKHILAVFYYDCYGTTEETRILPGDVIHIHILSIPYPSPLWDLDIEDLQFEVKVPGCTHPELVSTDTCMAEREFFINVSTFNCSNNTIHYTYNVPSEYGEFATLQFCEGTDEVINSCQVYINEWSNLLLNASAWLTIPDANFGRTKKYTLTLWGNKDAFNQRKAAFAIQACPVTKFTHLLWLLLLLCTCLLIFVCLLILFKYKKTVCFSNDSTKNSSKYDCDTTAFAKQYISPMQKNADSQCLTTDKEVCVYIVFVNDHPKHIEVLINLASFLQSDLGFVVIFELWDQQKVMENYTMWMENSMKKADKILVVWSPGATKRWIEYGSDNYFGQADIFTPVVKQIYTDLFNSRNCGKYIFAHFYYNPGIKDSLSEFRNLIYQDFLLMDNFPDLYFLLKDKEKFTPTGVYHVDKCDIYKCVNENQFGSSLKQAVLEMNEYAEAYPDWYKESNISAVDCGTNESPLLSVSRYKIKDNIYSIEHQSTRSYAGEQSCSLLSQQDISQNCLCLPAPKLNYSCPDSGIMLSEDLLYISRQTEFSFT